MESSHGPLVIEVNSSPGFEGIEKATGLNIAQMIMAHIRREVRTRRKSPRRRVKD
jgi:ribosomal protein S6--L-glutamate ligase